jgi:hypothetical protein
MNKMKSRTSVVTVLGLALVGLLAMTACRDLVSALLGGSEDEGNVTRVDERGYTDVDLQLLASALDEMAMGELSEAEVEGILYMREAEKLARDVCFVLGKEWDVPTLGEIGEREDTHTEAVRTVIDRYGLWDPLSVTSAGDYVNEELQELYHKLVARGSPSLAEALKVGVTIQEISILDLREYRAETDDADVQLVYENLLRGARNHLRVFAVLLRQQGETVERSYLSQTLFDEIVNTPIEPGRDQAESGG